MFTSQQGDGRLHRLHPLSKLAWVLALAVIVFILPQPWMPWIVFALLLVLAIGSRVLRPMSKPLLVVLVPFGISVFVIHGLFNPGNETLLVDLGPVGLWREGILFATLILGRVATVLMLFLMLLFTTTPRKIMTSLGQRGVSPKVGYVLLAAIEFIPDMQRRSQAVLAAQQSRGMDVKASLFRRISSFAALMGPLVGGAMIMADTRAMALEARAFSRTGDRTYLDALTESTLERALQWAALVAVLAVIVWRVFS